MRMACNKRCAFVSFSVAGGGEPGRVARAGPAAGGAVQAQVDAVDGCGGRPRHGARRPLRLIRKALPSGLPQVSKRTVCVPHHYTCTTWASARMEYTLKYISNLILVKPKNQIKIFLFIVESKYVAMYYY